MNTPPPVAAFSVSTQFENVGDAWLHRELLRLARERVTTWVDLSRCPVAFADDLDVEAYPAAERRDGVVALMLAMIAHRIRGGATSYFLSPGGYHGELEGVALLRAWAATAALAVLRAFGVRNCLVGASYERIGPHHRAVLRARTRLLHTHVVRDEASRRTAVELGLRVDAVLPDLSLATPSPGPVSLPSGTVVALAFRGDQAPGQAAEIVRFVRELASQANSAFRWRVIAQVARDVPLAETVASALSTDGHGAELSIVHHDLDAASRAYVGCRFVVGNRLHALLLGTHNGCAAVAVADTRLNAKVIGAFHDLGWADRVVAAEAPDSVSQVASLLRPNRWEPHDARVHRERIERFFDDLLGTRGPLQAPVVQDDA